jgi:hypothetical protein
MPKKTKKKLESKIPNSRNEVSRKKKAKPGKEKLSKWYEEQLAEKDRIIDRLKKENDLLLATALKQGMRIKEIFDKAEKAISRKK